MENEKAEAILRWVLYILGGLAALAFLPMVMPTSWMEATAVWLELEPLPRTPLAQYVTRSLCLVYGVFGVLTIFIAGRVRQHRQLLTLVACLTALMGLALTVLDFAIGMPASWSWGEGPPTMLCALAILWLARRVRPL